LEDYFVEPVTNISFKRSPCSTASHRGLVFVNHEEKRCIRSVTSACSEFLDSCSYACKAGEFWPEIKKLDYYSHDRAWYEVEYIDHMIAWSEMTNSQIKDCHIFMCDMLEHLNKSGITCETHMWNITLRNGKPFLFDIGDFQIFNKEIQRASLNSVLRNVADAHVPRELVMPSWLKNGDQVLHNINSCTGDPQSSRNEFVRSETVDQSNYWDDYNKFSISSIQDVLSSCDNGKDRPVCDYINKHKPETLTDIGCNTGKHCFYAAGVAGVNSCVGMDYSAQSINKANEVASNLNLNCSFAYLDLCNADKIGSEHTGRSVKQRLTSEMVIASAILHHLFAGISNSENKLFAKDIKKCIDVICSYATKYVAIEVIPHEDASVNRPIENWFSMEDVKKNIETNGFKVSSVCNSQAYPRQWVFAEKSI
jgi:hypothetical protein